ncbi:MAG TPA: ubiquinol-cytochrome c reductase iron-sulfur subunit [Anaerolineae bacterium]|nr:ubiquinol-cytochrome c reductase iron-sulfur subunit [Anaerolineae bacterium]HIQ06512.1 ubiquinol-cytochrome c reductase iron-sulfur subunit [Anaerolineae bacterium]
MNNQQSGASLAQERFNRRQFLCWLAGGSLSVALLGVVASVIRFLRPPFATEVPVRFTLREPSAYPLDTLVYEEAPRVWIGHDKGGFYAILAVCTHLGCTVQHKNAGFHCPCHDSEFDAAGINLSGPAPRPLDRVMVMLENGRLVVDVSQKVDRSARLGL